MAMAADNMAELARLFAVRMVDLTRVMEAGGRLGLAAAGESLANEVKRMIRLPYPPASVPGEPPHARRGEDGGLLGAYGSWRDTPDSVAVGARGTDPELQDVYLEMGTSKMSARPHLRPAAANMIASGTLREAFARSVQAAIRASIR